MTLPTALLYLTTKSPTQKAHPLLLRWLTHHLGSNAELAHHLSGAPYLPHHPHYTISISHSPHLLALALLPQPQAPLGIDVEEKWEQATRLLPRYSTPAEQALLQQHQLPPLALWCAKEAAYKAHSHLVTHYTRHLTLTQIISPTQLIINIAHQVELPIYLTPLTSLLPHQALLASTHPLTLIPH